MQQAELMGFLRTILIILFIYYLLKFLARIFAPVLMKKVVNNMQQKAQQQYNNQHQNTAKAKEGETVIDKKPNKQQESNSSVGEYVDFEELD
jgi:ABC-type multidrug transport system fused ATPase/permease subunit